MGSRSKKFRRMTATPPSKPKCPIAERPEWVLCILTGRFDIPQGEKGGPRKQARTWCGRDLLQEGVYFHFYSDLGFHAPQSNTFTDPTHAALVCAGEGRCVPCPECVAALVTVLQTHAKNWDGKPAPEDER